MDAMLADLARPYLNNAPGPERSRALERFRWRVAAAVHGRVSSGGVETPPIEVRRGADEPVLAIDVVVWRMSTLGRDLLGRISRMRAAAEDYRRGRGHDVLLTGLIVVIPGEEALDLAQLGLGLVAAAGLDRVVMCLATPDDAWFALDGVSLAPIADLAAALDHLQHGPPPPAGEEAVPTAAGGEAAEEADRRLRMLLVADEWHSTSGGISTVNREFGIALAQAGVDVRVLVPAADASVRAAARAEGVRLVTPPPLPGLTERELLLTPAMCDDGPAEPYAPDVIVGHGRVLGPYALAVQRSYFPAARRLHIVHTDADRLEDAKQEPGGPSRMMTANERRELELELATSADIVAGVGPHLARMIQDGMRGSYPRPPVLTMNPGLRDWGGTVDPGDLPAQRQVLLLARAEDVRSKGIDLAMSMVRRAIDRLGDGLERRPLLVIRGVRPEDDEEVKRRLDQQVQPELEVIRRPYSARKATLRSDLWSSRVVIMPSRHEGFGLAAYEAIAAGVPVLVTADSGLAELLSAYTTDGERRTPREVLRVRGSDEEIIELWATRLYETLIDPKAAFVRARELREQILAQVSWERTVADLLAMLASAPVR
jgi:glycosyltransferase involved in cell wall biosynthesis